ncbi:molecular chaperone [Sphingomonas sp. LHG3406-1]|uniref:fimbrial biogenesis chaperone n=1 Tax=Sphingomonas sp. LHG3406-1 TaxID=2804617 RepID=UPI00260509FA|nr:molecular chaperone [Sphingomonas sp. LHG3406-1]
MNITARSALRTALIAPLLALSPSATAGVGDLLVAPTRIILDGGRGTEIILNNIGDETATYRISVELKRMKQDGTFEDVTTPTASEEAARDMIVYAPRRVVLPPKQPQTIRIAARAPAGLPDGEYRVHMLFRAVPPAQPPLQTPADFKGIGFALTPVYGVTIPVIVRLGNLSAQAGIANVGKVVAGGKPAVGLELSRSGSRSTFGEIRVLKAGLKDPLAIQRGIAVYTEIDRRKVTVPIDDAVVAQATGPVTVQYLETVDGVTTKLAETSAVLR